MELNPQQGRFHNYRVISAKIATYILITVSGQTQATLNTYSYSFAFTRDAFSHEKTVKLGALQIKALNIFVLCQVIDVSLSIILTELSSA